MFSSKQNILVLDSDPQFLIALERVLEGEGFNTTTTWDVRQAIALLGSAHFDVLLVGEHPPELKSAELLKRLRSEHQAVPCLVMRPAARYPFEAQYLCTLGAYAVVCKWEHKRIVELVQQIICTTPQGAVAVRNGISAAAG